MTDLFLVKVVTPAGLQVEAKTSELTLENSDGQITILPSHVAYTSLLGTGILSFKDSDGQSHEFVTSGGFCNFTEDEITVLTDSVDYAADIDQSNLSEAITKLEDELGSSDLNSPEARLIQSEAGRLKAQRELVAN